MNMTKIVSAIKTELGLFDVTLPIVDKEKKEVPVEQVIYNVIKTVTIPMYSQYEPWKREGDCDIKSLKCVDQQQSIYMMPAILCMTPILYIIDIHMPYHNSRGTYGDIAPAYGINRSAQGVINSQAYMMLAGQMRAEPTWEWLKNNKIRLYGFPKSVLTFCVACEHMPNGETIDEGCYKSFLDLATLDMKIFLWNLLKRYKSIPSAHGNLNLEIDEYQSAESEKKAMLSEWDNVFHLDMGWEQFM